MQALRVTPGPGLAAPGVEAALVRFEAGASFGHHGHGGDETTLVLAGGFVDDLTGRHLRPGDTLHLPAGSAHALLVDPGEPCLAAVVLLGPLRV
ncbi:MAG: cupin domain-containing protein [Myxococcales bacterium]|nr:MAG: cupin domain-containing protein [Myxococcales bacterium]